MKTTVTTMKRMMRTRAYRKCGEVRGEEVIAVEISNKKRVSFDEYSTTGMVPVVLIAFTLHVVFLNFILSQDSRVVFTEFLPFFCNTKHATSFN